MKTNTINKIIFTSIILIAVLIIDFVLIYKIDKKYDEIVESKKSIVSESSRFNSLTDVKNKTQELTKIQNRIDDILISESNAVSFIGLIEDIAEQSGSTMNISKADFKDSEDEDDLGALDLTFKVTGSWEEVTNFLKMIESLPYLININSVRFSVIQSEEGSVWSVDFGLIGLTN